MNKVQKIVLNFLKTCDSFMMTFLTENALSNLYLNDSNTGIVLVAKSRPTLLHPMDYSPPGSSVQGISQAGILECVAISFCRGSSGLRD